MMENAISTYLMIIINLLKFVAYLDYPKVWFVFIIVDIKVITKSIYAVGFINV
jgi:hypothetical protein